MIEGHDILCFAPGPWDDIWRNRHQLMSRLARANRVLYVEPWPELRPTLRRLRHGQTGLSDLQPPRLRRISRGLSVFRPASWAPRSTRMPLRAVTDTIFMTSLRKAIRALDLNSPILWLFLPEMDMFVGRFGEKLVIYHIVDEYCGYTGISAGWQPTLRQAEERLARRADLVVVTSPELFERKKGLNRNTILVPNAVDYQAFAGGCSAPQHFPDELAGCQRPIAGYIGAINDKLDLELLARTATEATRWTLVLVGPIGVQSETGLQALGKLRALPNVRFVSARPVNEVPRFVAACDVCLLPYRIMEWTKHIDSLKLYEYLACAKPVVATDVPAARRAGDVVEIASSVDTLTEAMERALSSDSPERRQRRQEIASRNTWDSRIERLSDAIERTLRCKTEPADRQPASGTAQV